MIAKMCVRAMHLIEWGNLFLYASVPQRNGRQFGHIQSQMQINEDGKWRIELIRIEYRIKEDQQHIPWFWFDENFELFLEIGYDFVVLLLHHHDGFLGLQMDIFKEFPQFGQFKITVTVGLKLWIRGLDWLFLIFFMFTYLMFSTTFGFF